MLQLTEMSLWSALSTYQLFEEMYKAKVQVLEGQARSKSFTVHETS